MNEYLLDSDVIIWILRGREDTIQLMEKIKKEVIPSCSVLSVFEIQAGMRRAEESKTNQFLDALKVWAVNKEIATLAAKYVREYRKKSKTLNPIDTMIAATCVLNNLTLVTYNPKDYPIGELNTFKF